MVIGNTSGNDVGIIVRGGWFTHIVDDLPLPEVGPCGICTSRREIRRSSFGHEGNDGNQADSRVQRGDRDQEEGQLYDHRTQDFRQEVQVAEPSKKTTRKSAAKKTAKKAKDDELVEDEDTQVDDELDDDAEVNDDDLDVDDLDEDLTTLTKTMPTTKTSMRTMPTTMMWKTTRTRKKPSPRHPSSPRKRVPTWSPTRMMRKKHHPSGNPKRRVIAAGATADPVKDYLKQIGRVSLLNAEQEVDLSERIEAGLYAQHLLDTESEGMEFKRKRELKWAAADGKKAKDHLLEANLRLVVSLAKRYTGRGMPSLI